MTHTKECSVSQLQIAFTPPSGRLFSGGSGITNGVMLGHCPVQGWQAQPAPCFVDLQKAWGKVANDVNASFSQVGMA